jgi:hypothetical protein
VYPEFGVGTGEGSSRGNCPTYKIKIINHYAGQEIEVEVPEDRWVCVHRAAADSLQHLSGTCKQQHGHPAGTLHACTYMRLQQALSSGI